LLRRELAGRICIVDAVIEPSEFAVPATTMLCPTARLEEGREFNWLIDVALSKRTIFVPIVAVVLVEFGNWRMSEPLSIDKIVPNVALPNVPVRPAKPLPAVGLAGVWLA